MSTKTPLRFPSNATGGRKPDPSRALTSERLSQDLDAFAAAGGRIEVLGTTVTLKRLAGETEAAAAPATPAVRTRR